MKKKYFLILAIFTLHFGYSQKTVEFRIAAVSSDIGDMDGVFAGDSDPSWRASINDGFSTADFTYDLTNINCPGSSTINNTFFSKVYNCNLPTNYTFTWSAFENDGVAGDANTGIRSISIPSSSLTQPIFTTYATYTATANGVKCNSGSTVTWAITLQYRVIGSINPVSATNSQTNVTCFGGNDGSARVSPSGGVAPYTYSWSPSGGTEATASGLLAGNYTCIISDLNGCQTTKNFTITEPSAINKNITESAGILTATQSGATYQWYQCPNTLITGETNQNFTPTTIGDYKVDITLGSCTVTSDCFTVNTLDLDDFKLDSSFKLYPNPTENLIYIEFNTSTNANLDIVDINGRVLEKQNLNNTTNIININHLPKGIYLFKIYTNEGISIKKVVKE